MAIICRLTAVSHNWVEDYHSTNLSTLYAKNKKVSLSTPEYPTSFSATQQRPRPLNYVVRWLNFVTAFHQQPSKKKVYCEKKTFQVWSIKQNFFSNFFCSKHNKDSSFFDSIQNTFYGQTNHHHHVFLPNFAAIVVSIRHVINTHTSVLEIIFATTSFVAWHLSY